MHCTKRNGSGSAPLLLLLLLLPLFAYFSIWSTKIFFVYLHSLLVKRLLPLPLLLLPSTWHQRQLSFPCFSGFFPARFARRLRTPCAWVRMSDSFPLCDFFSFPVRFVNAGKHKTSNVNWKSFVCETECVISWSVYHFLQLLARACFKKFDSFPLFCSFLFLFVWRVNLSLNFWREVGGLGARRRGLVVCRTPRHALTVQCFVKSFISDSKTHKAHVASFSRL